jgi:hypothetical protein
MGHSRHIERATVTSAVPLTADISLSDIALEMKEAANFKTFRDKNRPPYRYYEHSLYDA